MLQKQIEEYSRDNHVGAWAWHEKLIDRNDRLPSV